MLESRKPKTTSGKRTRAKAVSTPTTQEGFGSKDELGMQLGVIDGGLAGCKTVLNNLRDTFQVNNGGQSLVSNSGDPGNSASTEALASDVGEASPSQVQGHAAQCDQDFVNYQSMRTEVQLLASSLVTFGRQLQTLQQKQLHHVTSSREDITSMLNKFDALQNLCRDTAAMGMQHAEAVLGLGLRMEVLEKQVAPLLEDIKHVQHSKAEENDSEVSGASSIPQITSEPGETPVNGKDAPARISDLLAKPSDLFNDKSYAALNQQYTETALKVFGQVSSIEVRMDKLEERIDASVQRAIEGLGLDLADKEMAQVLPFNSFDMSSTCSSGGGEVWNVVQADLVKQVEGLLNHVTQVEGLLQPTQIAGPPRRMASTGSRTRRHSIPSRSSRSVSPAVHTVTRQGSLPPAAQVQRMHTTPTAVTPMAPMGGSVTFPLAAAVSSLDKDHILTPSVKPPSFQHSPQMRGRRLDPGYVGQISSSGSGVFSSKPPPQTDRPDPTSPPSVYRQILRQPRNTIGGGKESKVERLIQKFSSSMDGRTSTPLRMSGSPGQLSAGFSP